MEKVFIKNRTNKKICVVIEETRDQKGLVFLMHGLGGFKDQPQIRVFSEVFQNNGYTVISFDVRNTLGESEGTIEEASTTSYYEDLEDVIKWAKTQEFYQEPFVLVGHSLGGICTALYSQKHPDEVLALAPLATVVSGKLSVELTPKEVLDEWEKTGWLTKESHSKPGEFKRIPWSEPVDRQKYDLLPLADKLKMPILMIVGENDTRTPLSHQQMLYEKLPGKKELHVIKGAEHTFKRSEDLEEIKKIIDKWIKSI